MNRIVWIVLVVALIVGVVVFVGKQKSGSGPGTLSGAPGEVTPSNPTGESGPVNGTLTPNGAKPGANPAPVGSGKAATAPGGAGGTAAGTGGATAPNGATGAGAVNGSPGTPSGTGGQSAAGTAASPGKTGEILPNGGGSSVPSKGSTTPLHDGVDGNIGAQPGDDGAGAPAPKPTSAPSLAGVKSPKVWLVAADLKKLPSAKGAGPFEIGNVDGPKATPWKNRSGSKLGDGVRAKGGTNATFVRGLQTTRGVVDAVAFCAPGVKECLNSAPSQIKVGLDLNHPESWVAGSDSAGKSPKGGSSFTALFVAARASQAANPLLENQNGESGATKGPFLGWIGPDLVGSIHGLQGIVGLTSVSVPSTWTAGVTPQIYTLRFDRKKSELKIFLVTDKGSASQSQAIEKGDGPDNDQYAAIAIGSKNPGKNAVTYVLEAATFSRALEDREICAIHKEWNRRYSLGIAAGQLKPCP